MKEAMTVTELRDALGVTEEQGYDVPFSTFTWERWQEMQTKMLNSFSSFQRAVAQRYPLTVMMIALEAQQIAADMQKEACSLLNGDRS